MITSTCFFLLCLFGHQAAALNCSYSNTKFWDQQLDHWGNNGTFKQQYQVIDDFYKPGGPILFYQGAENNKIACLNDYSIVSYAQQTGALVAQLEHRYFGDSLPFGNITGYDYNWSYLTLDNVMMDSVEFIRFLKRNTTYADAKTIVLGGSYGGFLTAMLRLNHPDTFDGAIASGAPLHLTAALFPNNTEQYVSAKWVNNVIYDISKSAAKKINNTWSLLDEYFESGKTQDLVSELRLCTAPETRTDIEMFKDIFALGLQRLSQFNFPEVNTANVSFPIQYIANKSMESISPLAPLAAFTSIYASAVDPTSLNCFNWTADGSAGVGGSGGVQMNPFDYIMCSYFPNSQQSTPPGMIFPSSQGAQYPCHTWFSKQTPHMITPTELHHRYRYSLEGISSVQNLLLVFGQYDPISGLFPENLPLSTDRSASRKLLVSELAHTAEMIAAFPSDPSSLTALRNTEIQYIKEWCSIS